MNHPGETPAVRRRRGRSGGVVVRRVPFDSPFYRAGLRARDTIVAVNGETVRDELELQFLAAEESVVLDIRRGGVRRALEVWRAPGEFVDIELHPQPIRRCGNRCIFCFIDQLPPGLRKSLYVKDEDYRHSFTSGNYITLTTTSGEDLERIARFGLSPLYVSVHATDPAVRRRMLGIRRGAAILSKLAWLAKRHIRFHTQIVVCPGVNDGAVLERSVRDLLALGEACLSVAVVPVGLTRHRERPLAPVSPEKARELCGQVQVMGQRDRAGSGTRRVFAADELFIRAGLAIPSRAYYGDYPQIENGVGLVRLMLNQWGRERRNLRKGARSSSRRRRKRRLLLLTSVSAQRYLETVARGIEEETEAASLTVRAVENRFLGETVTVAGLLAGADLIRAARAVAEPWDELVIPAACLNHRDHTLDSYSVERIGQCLGRPVRPAGDVAELVRIARGKG